MLSNCCEGTAVWLDWSIGWNKRQCRLALFKSRLVWYFEIKRAMKSADVTEKSIIINDSSMIMDFLRYVTSLELTSHLLLRPSQQIVIFSIHLSLVDLWLMIIMSRHRGKEDLPLISPPKLIFYKAISLFYFSIVHHRQNIKKTSPTWYKTLMKPKNTRVKVKIQYNQKYALSDL